MLSMMATPVFAETTLEITNNGAGSDNTIIAKQLCANVVVQKNKTVAETSVVSVATTGGNTASGNTGGTTEIDTGSATSTVTVSVTGGDNVASAPDCCECLSGDAAVVVSGNGAKSSNKVVKVDAVGNIAVQKTKTKALTGVTSIAKTGKNKAKHNTGNGTTITTDDSESTVDVTVAGGSSLLTP
jgi:hypothetical protein